MSSNTKIAGIVVDGKTAFEYKKKAFIVGGMSVSWGLIEEAENVLKGLSKPSGLCTDMDFCNACRTIWQKEHERLAEANRANGLNMAGEPIKNIENKGELVMKHKDFKGYLSDAKEIYEKARVEYERLQDEWKATQEEYKRIQRDGLTERGNAIVRGQFLQYEDEYKQGMANLEQSVKTQLAEVRKAMEEHTREFYRADPSKLDSNTMTLLNSGILTTDELIYLAEQNTGNTTMLRLIGAKAKEKLKNLEKGEHDDNLALLNYGIAGMGSGEHELKAFDDVSERLMLCLNRDRSYADAHNRAFNTVYEGQSAILSKMIAQPEVSAE